MWPAMLAGSKYVTHSRHCLLSARSAVLPALSNDVITHIGQLGVRRHRGCRSGRTARDRRARPPPALQQAVNGAYLFTSRTASSRRCHSNIQESSRRWRGHLDPAHICYSNLLLLTPRSRDVTDEIKSRSQQYSALLDCPVLSDLQQTSNYTTQHSLETSAHHNDKSVAGSSPVTDVHSLSDDDFVMWSEESTANISPDISQSVSELSLDFSDYCLSTLFGSQEMCSTPDVQCQQRLHSNVLPKISRCILPKVLNANIRAGFCQKLDEMTVVLQQNLVDIACITETWLNPLIPSSSTHIDGYVTYRRDRDDGRQGVE